MAKKRSGRGKASRGAASGRKRVGKKRAAKRAPARRAARARVREPKAAPRKPRAGRKKTAGASRSGRSSARPSARLDQGWRRGLGPESAGQAGDTERISREELADSESVEELLEEGQAFEAGIVSGVENARDADKGGVRTREVPEDDVPQEYLDED